MNGPLFSLCAWQEPGCADAGLVAPSGVAVSHRICPACSVAMLAEVRAIRPAIAA